MKKLFSLLVILALVMSLCACGSSQQSDTISTEGASEAVFMAGFGAVNVTPNNAVNMAGYGDHDTRLSDGYVTYLEARAVAIVDENGEKMLFLVVDTSFAYPAVGQNAIKKLKDELGIPEDHIILAGTHTHNSVATWVSSNSGTAAFNNKYIDGCLEAAQMALDDCKPADVYVGSAKTENLNFVRRYIMDDGSLKGDGADGTGSYIVSHETEVDNEAQLLKFARKDGKDILVVNYQAHPHLEGKLTSLSADTPSAIREALENKLDVNCLYWQGAAGNINSSSRIDGETQTKNRKEYGELFANQVAKYVDSMTQVKTGPIKVTAMTYTGDANHTMDHLINTANTVMTQFNAGVSIDDCGKLAKELGLNSFYHARNIVGHAKLGPTYSMDISAFSFGDVSGIVVPYEMFDTSGMQIKADTPFEKTFIVGYAYPGYQGYIPTEEAWKNGGYEVETSNYAPGNAEKLVEAYLGMLNDLKG